MKNSTLSILVLLFIAIIAFAGCGSSSSGGNNPPPTGPTNPTEPTNPTDPTDPLPIVPPSEANLKIIVTNSVGTVDYPMIFSHREFNIREMGKKVWIDLGVYDQTGERKLYYGNFEYSSDNSEYYLTLSPDAKYVIRAHVYRILPVVVDTDTYYIKVVPLGGQIDMNLSSGLRVDATLELEKFIFKEITSPTTVQGGDRFEVSGQLWSPVDIRESDGGRLSLSCYYQKATGNTENKKLELDEDEIREIVAKTPCKCSFTGEMSPTLEDVTYNFLTVAYMGEVQNFSFYNYCFSSETPDSINVLKMEDGGELIIGVN